MATGAKEKLLELGAGNRPFEDGRGWIHNDARAGPDIEIVCDARRIYNHTNGVLYDEIRATHLLEHFSYLETVSVLTEWKAILKQGGSLYLEVPNLRWQVDAFHSGEIDADKFVYYAYGEQNYSGNYHYAAFDQDLLRRRLNQAGFNVVGLTNIGQVLCAKAIN